MTTATVHPIRPDVFGMRDDLAHLHQLARAKRVGPDALLALTLTAVLAATEPTVSVDIGMGRGSLNYMTALVGPSGGGKGLAEATAREQIIVTSHDGEQVVTPTRSFGSGEGLASTYRPRGLPDDEPNILTRAVFSAAEIDKITAITSRTGSTLSSALREAWMGEMLGASNATADNSNNVAHHTYRWCAVLGVQPKRAGALLGESDGGTPQRVLWAPVGDPGAPRHKPSDPGPLPVQLPELRGTVALNVNSEITAGYDFEQFGRLHAPMDGDAIDGHTRLVQLKTAAALALMDTRTVVGVDDWEIAAAIVDRSTETREQVRAILTAGHKAEVIRKAEERADVSMHTEDHREQENRNRVRDRLVARLEKYGPQTKADLYRAVRANLRDHFDPVLVDLADSDVVTFTGDKRFKLNSEG